MESIRNPLPKPPKYMDADYRTLPDIESNPLFYDEDAQEILCYWTDGKMVYWRYSPVSNDVEHFVWFNNHFAKDSNWFVGQVYQEDFFIRICKSVRDLRKLSNCHGG